MGDVGGFNGAVIIFPSFLMSWYASRKFNASIYEEMPIKKQHAKKRGKEEHEMDGAKTMSDLQRKLLGGQESLRNGLEASDVKSLVAEA